MTLRRFPHGIAIKSNGKVTFDFCSYDYRAVYACLSSLKPEDQEKIRATGRVAEDHYFNFYVPTDKYRSYFPHHWICADGCLWADKENFKPVRIIGRGSIEYCETLVAVNRSYTFVEPGYYKFEVELPEYHCTEVRWRHDRSNKTKKVLGVELEVKAKCRETRKKLRDYIYSLGENEAIIESDGSLCHTTGAEIVFSPKSEKELLSDKFKGILENIESYCDGSVQPDNYGMHLNVSAGWFGKSLLHKMKFVHLINEARDLTESVAGRTANQYACFDFTRFKDKRYDNNGKYAVVNTSRMNDRLEVRIFRSMLDWTKFTRQVNYTLSIIEYTNQASMQAINKNSYLHWLGQNKKLYNQILSS